MPLTQKEFNLLKKQLEKKLIEKSEKLFSRSSTTFMDRDHEEGYHSSSISSIEDYVNFSNDILKNLALKFKYKFQPFDSEKIINHDAYLTIRRHI